MKRYWSNLVKIRHTLQYFDINLHKFIFTAVIGAGIGLATFVELRIIILFIDTIIHPEQTTLTGFFINFFSFTSTNRTIELTSILLVFIIIKTISIATSYYIETTIAREMGIVEKQFRGKIYENFLQYGQSFYAKHSYSELQHFLLGFTQRISSTLQSLHVGIRKFFILIAYLITLYIFSWQIAVVSLILVYCITVCTSFFNKAIDKNTQIEHLSRRGLEFKIFNILTNIGLVKALVQEQRELEYFNSISHTELQTHQNQIILSKKINTVQEILSLIALFCLLFIITFALPNTISPTGILICAFIFRQMSNVFSGITESMAQLRYANYPLLRIKQLLNKADKDITTSGSDILDPQTVSITFNNVSFGYRKNLPVLTNISFTIKANEIIAITGKSGSGKSTITQLIVRFYEPDSGTILINNKPITEYSLQSLRNNIHYVSQEVPLFHESLLDNICYGNSSITEEDVNQVLKKVQLDDLVQRLPEGLHTIIGDRGMQISGGERQRIALARCFLSNAPLWILDEATCMLDQETEQAIINNLLALEGEKTIIVIGHTRNVLENFSNQYAV